MNQSISNLLEDILDNPIQSFPNIPLSCKTMLKEDHTYTFSNEKETWNQGENHSTKLSGNLSRIFLKVGLWLSRWMNTQNEYKVRLESFLLYITYTLNGNMTIQFRSIYNLAHPVFPGFDNGRASVTEMQIPGGALATVSGKNHKTRSCRR